MSGRDDVGALLGKIEKQLNNLLGKLRDSVVFYLIFHYFRSKVHYRLIILQKSPCFRDALCISPEFSQIADFPS